MRRGNYCKTLLALFLKHQMVRCVIGKFFNWNKDLVLISFRAFK